MVARVELARLDDQEGWTDQYPLQSCYNAFVRAFLSANGTTLVSAELDAFAEQFRERCMSPARGEPH